MGRRLSADDVFVFYNFHSLPLEPSAFPNLLDFLKSTLSVDRLNFSFCCDTSKTPSATIRYVSTIPDCQLVNLPYTSDECFEKAMGQRMVELSETDNTGIVALVSEAGNYALAMDVLSMADWRLIFFHPPNTAAAFLDVIDRTVELPVHIESPSLPLPLDSSASRMEEMKMQLGALNQCLVELLNRYVALSHAEKYYRVKKEETPADGGPQLHGFEHKASGVKRNEKQLSLDDGCVDNKKTTSWTSEAIEKRLKEGGRPWNNWDVEEEADTKTVEQFQTQDTYVQTGGSRGKWDKEESDDEEEANGNGWARPKFGRGAKNPFGGHHNPFGGYKSIPDTDSAFKKAEKPNPFQKPMPFERPNPFQKPNPFEKPNPFGRSPPFEKPNPFQKALPPRTQRNPFAGGFQSQAPPRGENSSGFRKPAPQCSKWEVASHKSDRSCTLWHPRKDCFFYPNCRSTAANCGYAHPFCSEGECVCQPHQKDPQLNHNCLDQ